MITARRLVQDESGMTMALAIIMILLLGVMGAGLLTFVGRDLNTVVEENRGQRAFEAADAGIAAAKQQLADNVDRTAYDGDGAGNCVSDDTDDIQWSALLCDGDLDDDISDGLTLNDLDDDGSTPDSVTVRIRYVAENESPDIPEEHFLVVSEGTYGSAVRKIEAIFKGVPRSFCFDDVCPDTGQPLYYTPSSIAIDGPKAGIKGVSLFSRQDILIEGVTSKLGFQQDYDDANTAPTNTFVPGSPNEALCDWNSADPVNPANCFKNATGNYNTTSRLKGGTKFQKVGLAAEGTICGYPAGLAPPPTCGSSASVADGVYGYDKTTTPKFVAKETLGLNPANDVNPTDTITYPFPRLIPNADVFKESAEDPDNPATDTYFDNPAQVPVGSTWGLSPATGSGPTNVAFVDARGGSVTFDPDGPAAKKGIIVVWCGKLEQNNDFTGIIFNLYGDDLGPGSTDCADAEGDPEGNVGLYRNNGVDCKCWVYAQGGTLTTPGIVMRPNPTTGDPSSADFLPAGTWSNSVPDGALTGPPPTSFTLTNWRELYS